MKKGAKKYLLIAATMFVIFGVGAAILIQHANRLIERQLRETLGQGFSVKKISLTWGKVEATGIRLTTSQGKEVLKTDTLVLKADFRSALSKDRLISSLVLKSPYLLIETDRKGILVNPVIPKKADQGTSPPSLFIQDITIENGSLDYLNGKIAKSPFLTKLRNIKLDFQNMSIPFREVFSTYSLLADIPGKLNKGTLQSKGKIMLKTMDTECTVTLKGLDITGFKPYFQKKGDVDVTRGLLDLDMTIKISANKIHAPGRAVLKDLQFRSDTGTGQHFLSLPLRAVMNFLKDNNNQIAFDFILEGNLNNPQFNIRQSLVEKITLGLAQKLGLSVTKIGESIIVLGGEGLKQFGKGIKGVGEGIRDIFK